MAGISFSGPARHCGYDVERSQMVKSQPPAIRVKRLVSGLRRRLGRRDRREDIDWTALHLEPLSHLSTILSLHDLDETDLNPIGHRLDDVIRQTPERAAKALQTAFYAYQGPVTPTLNRLIIHALDAEWRSHADQAEKGKALRRKLHRLEVQFGHVPGALLYRGALALRAGDRDEAMTLQAQAARDMGSVGMPWMHIGAHALRPDGDADWIDGAETASISKAQPSVDWYRQAEEIGPLCLVAGGDAAFFRGYGAGLYTSLRRLDTISNIHFHIVNFTPGCAAILDQFKDARLSVTTETYPFTDDRTYFASVRFSRLSEIITQLGTPAYITDLDNIVTQAPSEAANELASCDAAFHAQASQTWFPWWGPSAFNTYISAASNGLQIVRWMNAYLAARFRPGDPFRSWWVDQLMLNEVGHAAERAGFNITTSRVPALTLTQPRPRPELLEIRAKLLSGAFSESG